MDMNDENINTEMESGAKSPISITKLKEYGTKAYKPLVDVVFKYQDEFTPYLSALAKGLEGGKQSLSREGASEPERYVAQFFQQAADGLNQACQKLESKDVNAITTFLTEQAEQRPSVMFSTSYIAGIFFGRLGRHIARKSTIH
jgi:hypothetical protein